MDTFVGILMKVYENFLSFFIAVVLLLGCMYVSYYKRQTY